MTRIRRTDFRPTNLRPTNSSPKKLPQSCFAFASWREFSASVDPRCERKFSTAPQRPCPSLPSVSTSQFRVRASKVPALSFDTPHKFIDFQRKPQRTRQQTNATPKNLENRLSVSRFLSPHHVAVFQIKNAHAIFRPLNRPVTFPEDFFAHNFRRHFRAVVKSFP